MRFLTSTLRLTERCPLHSKTRVETHAGALEDSPKVLTARLLSLHFVTLSFSGSSHNGSDIGAVGRGSAAAGTTWRSSLSRRSSSFEEAAVRDRQISTSSFKQGLTTLRFKLTEEVSKCGTVLFTFAVDGSIRPLPVTSGGLRRLKSNESARTVRRRRHGDPFRRVLFLALIEAFLRKHVLSIFGRQTREMHAFLTCRKWLICSGSLTETGTA